MSLSALGFQGFNCSENKDDCPDVSCGPGVCVDGVESAVCTCPVGRVGLDCNKSQSNHRSHGIRFILIRNFRASASMSQQKYDVSNVKATARAKRFLTLASKSSVQRTVFMLCRFGIEKLHQRLND